MLCAIAICYKFTILKKANKRLGGVGEGKFVDLRVFMEDLHPCFGRERRGYIHSSFTEIKASLYSNSAVLNHGKL